MRLRLVGVGFWPCGKRAVVFASPAHFQRKSAILTSWNGSMGIVYQRPSRDFRALGELPAVNLELLSTSTKMVTGARP